MSATVPVRAETSLFSSGNSFSPPARLLPGVLVATAGLVMLAIALLWRMWTTDALRSIGMYFPLISLALTGRVWRGMNWEARGTWWGLLPLLYAGIAARSVGNTSIALAFSPRFAVPLLPVGVTMFAYASGVVLLLGGFRVWRKAIFPLALLLFVNPVPKAFALLDLPLQYVSANTARAMAAGLGLHLTGQQLQLMFAPEFGMFIAPGCNGIRGAITLGYLALIAGYMYRFSRGWQVLSVLGAVTVGYLFNLVRLCVLVLFYWVGLRIPSLQSHGEGADYVIGAALFLGAAALLGLVVRWKRRDVEGESIVAAQGGPELQRAYALGNWRWKSAVLCSVVVLVVLPFFSRVWAITTGKGTGESVPSEEGVFPARMGKYQLLRSWLEQDSQNQLTYRWGTYSVPGQAAAEIDMSYWFGAYVHYPMACHLYRGDVPLWEGVSELRTADGSMATFVVSFYRDSNGQSLEASTACDADGCTESVQMPSARPGIMFTSTGIKNFLFRPAAKPIPVLIREQSDSSVTPETAKAQMMDQLRDFVSALDTRRLALIAESRN